jgi:flagellar biosynthesis protein FliP
MSGGLDRLAAVTAMVVVSLLFKLIFVLIDGRSLVADSRVQSYRP